MEADKNYLRIAAKILEYGVWKQNRTGVPTIAIPFQHFEHNMADGFPLLTTKKMGLKNIATELEFFIKGLTSKKWLQDRGCKIWDEWANPQKVAETIIQQGGPKVISDLGVSQKDIQKVEDDLGPVYGYQWRHFGKQYAEPIFETIVDSGGYDQYYTINDDGLSEGVDQLASIVDKIKNNPEDRRMICTAWNPQQLSQMALPACHLLWQVVIIKDTLHLHWHQRSCDYFLGVPYNIASYALLLKLLAKEGGYKEGMLSATLGDCHIYENHVDQIKKQMTREPRVSPYVEIIPKDENNFSIFSWEHTDLSLANYNPHPAIKGEVAV